MGQDGNFKFSSGPTENFPFDLTCDNYVNGGHDLSFGHGYGSVYSFGGSDGSSISEGQGASVEGGSVKGGSVEGGSVEGGSEFGTVNETGSFETLSLVGPKLSNDASFGSFGGSLSSISEINSAGVASGSLTPELDSNSQSQLVWVDHSRDAMAAKTAVDEVGSVRKRLEKRKRRNAPKTSPVEVSTVTKRTRNTLAARRYRQRRQEEVEILDTKVRELEAELAKAKLEAKWWQMESQRWKEMAKREENEEPNS